MANVEVTVSTLAGTAGAAPAVLTPAAALDIFMMPLDPQTILEIRNGAGVLDVTFMVHHSVDGLALPDKVVRIGANQTVLFVGFAREIYGESVNSDAILSFQLSKVTAIALAAFRT